MLSSAADIEPFNPDVDIELKLDKLLITPEATNVYDVPFAETDTSNVGGGNSDSNQLSTSALYAAATLDCCDAESACENMMELDTVLA